MMYTNDYLTDRIQTYNKLNMQKEETELYSFAEASKMISAEEIKKYLCRYQWSNEKFVDDNDREITAKDIALLKSKLNLEKLSAQIAPNYAICVQNTNLRLFPTKQGCYKEKKKAIDYFAVSLVKIGERVICWHKDKSGKWCFIQTKNAWGWVYTHTLALMDEENWLKINEQEFIQVLTPRIKPDNCNALFLYATRLPFVGIYAQKYAAMLPKRNKWGEAYFDKILIPQNSPVSIGNIAFTPQQAAFEGCKFLQEKYDWGGKHGRHDCTSLLGDIFSVFGIKLASNSHKMLLMEGVEHWEKDWDVKARIEKLQKISPGSILLFKGHGMLYLGKRGDQESILHSVYRLSKPFEGQFYGYNINKTTVGDLKQYRENGKSLLASIEGSLDLFSLTDNLIS